LNNRFNNQGFTLIELIISIAILSIILVSFMSLLGNGTKNVFSMGHKTQAVAEAQSIIDTVYNAGDTSDTFIQNIDPSTNYQKIDDCNLLESGTYTYRVRYCVEEITNTINGNDYTQDVISVLVFYNNGKNYTVVSSIIPR